MNKLNSHFNRKLLHSEIEILKLLRNYNNIINVENVYTTKNNTYIVSEICTGDLQQILKKNGKLSELQVFKYMGDILEAYGHIY